MCKMQVNWEDGTKGVLCDTSILPFFFPLSFVFLYKHQPLSSPPPSGTSFTPPFFGATSTGKERGGEFAVTIEVPFLLTVPALRAGKEARLA